MRSNHYSTAHVGCYSKVSLQHHLKGDEDWTKREKMINNDMVGYCNITVYDYTIDFPVEPCQERMKSKGRADQVTE